MKVTVADLACTRGDYPVFDGVSFAVSSGEALQLTGNNGSGKSSLLRLLCGLLETTGGSIELEGHAPETNVADNCHYLGHDNALKGPMTALANLDFLQTVFGQTGIDPLAALKMVGLQRVADLPAAYLSAGQKRRVALARLLVSKRTIWLLDEPTAALDAKSEALLGELVDDHMTDGGLVIAATHLKLPFKVAHSIDMSMMRPGKAHASGRISNAPDETAEGAFL